MEIKKLGTVESTNTWVSQHESGLSAPFLVYCEQQTAGRGQRGNTWESAPGKNITASLLLRPENFEAAGQFAISEAVSLSIVSFLKIHGVEAGIKWPNDIYTGDKKICGILVEHVVTGKNITRTIAGIGININQECFISDAPNPVSLTMLTGKKYNIEDTVAILADCLAEALEKLDNPEELHSEFLKHLWRNDKGFHKFYDRKCSENIEAAIEGVASNGILILKTKSGEVREYTFKEVEFII